MSIRVEQKFMYVSAESMLAMFMMKLAILTLKNGSAVDSEKLKESEK